MDAALHAHAERIGKPLAITGVNQYWTIWAATLSKAKKAAAGIMAKENIIAACSANKRSLAAA